MPKWCLWSCWVEGLGRTQETHLLDQPYVQSWIWGPATKNVDEDAMVTTLLETRVFMIAQLAAEAAKEGETHSLHAEHDGLDSPEYVDIFYDDTSGRPLDPAGVKAATQTEIEFIESAGVWGVVPRSSFEPWNLRHPRTVGGHQLR